MTITYNKCHLTRKIVEICRNYEALAEMFIFETSQLIDQLEISILIIEKSNTYTIEWINEIFRAMHTIKGSSSVMMLINVASVSHAMEDLFYYIREERPQHIDLPALSDLILEGVDFIKVELHKFKYGETADGTLRQVVNFSVKDNSNSM
ncbi:Hpt domain-containing protein [Paenibacillus sp. M.A.Huq-84]